MALNRQVFVFLMVTCLFHQTHGGLLPQFVCNGLVNVFQSAGCANGETVACRNFYRFLTGNVIFGLKACDNFACQFYDAPAQNQCQSVCGTNAVVSLGICRRGLFCCPVPIISK